jgi:hypothetical protein
MRCMSKNRDECFTDVGELARALVPYGSGTWIQSADRITATLNRAVDESQAVRSSKGQPTSMDRLAIPSSPGKRLDSLQPELHGTASTVARRFSVLESPRTKWILGLAGLGAIVGAVLIIGTWYRNQQALPPVGPDPAAATSTEPPPEPAGFVPMGQGINTPTPHIVASGDEAPPLPAPAGTVIGASPAGTQPGVAPPPNTSAKRPNAPPPPAAGRPPSPPVATTVRKPPSPPTPVKSTALPPELPRSRQ